MTKKVNPQKISVLNDEDFYKAARKYLEAGKTFTEETSYGTRKAEELLVAAFVNKWLALKGDDRCLKSVTANKGADCIVHRETNQINGVNKVEIKTLKVKENEAGGPFEFGHHFLPKDTKHQNGVVLNSKESAFNEHMMVVCAYLKDAAIRTIYIAHGPSVMNELARLLAKDTQRDGFKIDRERKKDNPRLFKNDLDCLAASSASSASSAESATKNYPFSKTSDENWVKKINENDQVYLDVIKRLDGSQD